MGRFCSLLLALVLLSFASNDFVQSTMFTVVNMCNYTVWPGVKTYNGTFSSTGFTLATGERRTLKAPVGWIGRFWGRTGCKFDDNGRGNCSTGDCGSDQIECNGAGSMAPATLVEFTLNGPNGKDFYDVSLVDGKDVNTLSPGPSPGPDSPPIESPPIESPLIDSSSGYSNKNKKKVLAIVLSLVSGMLLVACLGCFLWFRRKKKKNATIFLREKASEKAREDGLELPSFDFPTIAAATDNFSDANKLGAGGFGPVYKGKLGEDQEIAVKRLAKTSQQGVIEFKNEVMLIAKLQHRNLVRLLGCCIQGEERMLIYEYMVNKSLDSFLFDKEKAALLEWKTRYQIIIGITRGLLYLHHDSRFRIIHRDLKASNILLDKDMNPKISDFGMARIFGGDETDINTRKVVGTYGYMSPEYALDGNFSMKSDVFSYGVVVLEIISGQKNRGVYAHSPYLNLVAHAWDLWNEGKSSQLVDETVSDSVSMNEVLKCIKIGLLCVQERAEDRPLMSTVIQMLGSDIASLPQPKKPGFIARMDPVETNKSSSKQTSNEMTISLLDGR